MKTTARGRHIGRRIAAVATVVALGITLASCSSSTTSTQAAGSSADLDAALQAGGELTYWSWTPSGEAQVAAFEKAYPKVKVNLVNAGTNTTEYTKLQNAIKAGSGAPDVVQVEYYAIPQFALSNSLVDLSSYGLSSLQSAYSAGTWNSVNIDGKLYGLPQDSGPMAMFYNKTVFDKYGLTVPTTWDEYIADAKKLHTADPTKYITADTGDSGFTTSMIWQAGGRPFTTTNGTTVNINFSNDGTTKYTTMWQQLIDQKLLSGITSWSDEWYKGLANGTISTLITGAWMPGVLESSVTGASGDWRVAAIPTYDGTPVTSENGGSATAVTKQSSNPALAAAFLRWLNNSQDSIDIFRASGGFPSTTADLTSSSFLAEAPAYFGGQKINEVLSAASSSVATGWQYLPFQVYANSIFSDTVGKSYAGGSTLQSGLASWQQQLTDYGNAQGFTVSNN